MTDVDCNFAKADWPFMPVRVPCGSARTIAVAGCAFRGGVRINGYSVRVTNPDGVSLTVECRKLNGCWVATFPASHFATYGTVKNGVVVFAAGTDERGVSQIWIERTGDLVVFQVAATETPGGTVEAPKDVFHKSEIVDGVQHYKRETLTYSQRQQAWGVDFTGDYVFVGGDFVPFTPGE